MVVEILETKLDDDYIEYIANMIAKKTSDDTALEDQEPDNRTSNWEEKSEDSRKNPTDWPTHWDYMDPRQVSAPDRMDLYRWLMDSGLTLLNEINGYYLLWVNITKRNELILFLVSSLFLNQQFSRNLL